MPGILSNILICTAVCCGIMIFVWIWAVKIKNAGVVDIFWSFNFPVIAVLIYFLADGFDSRKLIICAMMFVAYLRLGIHLAQRVTSHLDEEEGRYKQLRKEWSPNADRQFFWFFQFQALSNIILATPLFIASVNKTPEIHFLEYLALGIWLIGFIGEGIADSQLKAFKKDPKNKDEVCDDGLWNYSRHPNYFFQWILWMAYFLFALASPYGWIAIISPAIILYLLLKVTGIPATEAQSIRSKGDKFRAYQKTTSAFVPWFKLKK